MVEDSMVNPTRWIRPLPERLINKIAAGEVIERPAAVLKELVENSLDAGSTQIDIIVEKSGTRRIVVIDNGCGINPDQIEIAFARHATSKISNFDDLDQLRSFGFRGEALPSIGSVSKTRMVSKTAEADTAMEIIIEAGVVRSLKPASAPIGTRVEVENLFFNTPARRKFLKSETTEAQHLTRNATALALSTPEVAFSYIINNRKLFSLTPRENDPETRVARLLLAGSADQLFHAETATNELKVQAYLSFPLFCRRNQYGLYIFINNRYIKSPTLVHAVTSGYAELLERGSYPAGAVFLTLNPAEVDVNVHPTKAEVRLSDERRIHDILHHIVRRSLRESGQLPTPRIVAGEQKALSDGHTAQEALRRLQSPSIPRPASTNTSLLRELYGKDEKPIAAANMPLPPVSENEPIISDRQTIRPDNGLPDFDAAIFMGRFSGVYLLFAGGDQLYIVDQHAAHERIIYEETMRNVEDGSGVSQNLLFPVNVDLPADQYALYENAAAVLKAAGFETEPFGPSTVMLSAVPSVLAKQSPERVFMGILADVEAARKAGSDLKKGIAQSIACRASVMAGDRVTEEEARALLRQLAQTKSRHSCPHGRPVILTITKYELDSKFGRK
ncbi:MAG: DNA mismatch repair endonuclease MutL [Candidatus Zixiibacteriota bacterium]|nr:MAG: DNA mismatch repair endonuclease MutL [candidate division Zixibacteria bacterium]